MSIHALNLLALSSLPPQGPDVARMLPHEPPVARDFLRQGCLALQHVPHDLTEGGGGQGRAPPLLLPHPHQVTERCWSVLRWSRPLPRLHLYTWRRVHRYCGIIK